MSKAQSKDKMTEAAANARQAEADLKWAVADAYAAGNSWAEIGAALGISKQTAYNRFNNTTAAITGLDTSKKIDVPAPAPAAAAPKAAPKARKTASKKVDVPAPAPRPFMNFSGPLDFTKQDATDDKWYAANGCGECGRKDRPDSCPNCHRRTR